MTRPNLAGRLHRWSLTLQEYEFEILYRPGATNVVADALSRAPAAVLAAIGRRATRGRRSARGRRTERTTRAAEEAGDDSKTEDDDPDHSPTPIENTETVVETLTTDDGVETEDTTATAPVQTQTLVLDGDRNTETAGGRAEVNRPLTRAAKRRLEAEAAARATRQAADDERRAGSAPDGDESDALLSATRPTVDDANSASTRVDDVDMTRPVVNDTDTASPEADDVDAMNESSSAHVQAADTATGGRSAVTTSGTIATTDGTVERATAASVTRDDGTEPPLRVTDTTTTVTTSGTAPSRRRVTWTKPEREVTSTDSDVESETNELSGVTSTGKAKTQRRTKAATDVPVAKRPPAKRRSTSGKSPTAVSTLATDVADDAPETEEEETALPEGTLQLSDDEIAAAQKASRMVQKMAAAGNYHGLKVEQIYGLVVVNTKNGRRVVLPPALWAIVFKEMHGSVWAGHLRGPHTYGRVAQLYWWPGLQREVNQWVRGCQECGSRKARPRGVIPPLRSIRGGDVGDRWALDVAGPFPVADGGERYVIAALEYVTRYAVAKCVTRYTAENVATFLMEDVVLKFGVFREILTDGAPELTGKSIEQLVLMLQSKQINPVPYRPQMIGLVERFHHSWKDCVAMYMANEQQNDWNLWVKFAVYTYNSARHSTVALSPNELMMGRRLRPPNELLRRMETTEAGELMAYHEKLLAAMTKSHECAAKAMEKEQRRQARYYNRKTKQKREFRPGDRVWVHNPPRGPKATKFVHKWMGPMRVVESAGYENFLLQREDKSGAPETVIAHVSFLVSYHLPTLLLQQAATDIEAQLDYEDQSGEQTDESTNRAPVRAATAGRASRKDGRHQKRRRGTMADTGGVSAEDTRLVEGRRRRRRNKAGQYVLEYELLPVGDERHGNAVGERLWLSVADYERLCQSGRVVEDTQVGEAV
ncbi:hypothetical protein PF003_g18984 [Phytophthora fragariae]|nr:hypothetical protein PF003_g18984 [Phytophthora fragariae]